MKQALSKLKRDSFCLSKLILKTFSLCSSYLDFSDFGLNMVGKEVLGQEKCYFLLLSALKWGVGEFCTAYYGPCFASREARGVKSKATQIAWRASCYNWTSHRSSGSSALRAQEHLSALLRKRPAPETFLAPFQSTTEFYTKHNSINSKVHKKCNVEEISSLPKGTKRVSKFIKYLRVPHST